MAFQSSNKGVHPVAVRGLSDLCPNDYTHCRYMHGWGHIYSVMIGIGSDPAQLVSAIIDLDWANVSSVLTAHSPSPNIQRDIDLGYVHALQYNSEP